MPEVSADGRVDVRVRLRGDVRAPRERDGADARSREEAEVRGGAVRRRAGRRGRGRAAVEGGVGGEEEAAEEAAIEELELFVGVVVEFVE